MTGQILGVTDERACSCGDTIKVATSSIKGCDDIIAAFMEMHTGEGHALTTFAEAGRAGRRRERAR